MMTTIVTLPRISSTALSSIILSQSPSDNPSIAVIDVRDDDHIGGHIRNSTHIPSSTLDHQIPSLVHKLRDKEVVVFHCALSQQRGPSAALQYLRERDRLLGPFTKNPVGEALMKSAAEAKESKGGKKDSGTEWEDLDDGKRDGEETRENGRDQKVYVLDRGFVGWQEVYGEDERLTEGYRKELWKDGYWM